MTMVFNPIINVLFQPFHFSLLTSPLLCVAATADCVDFRIHFLDATDA
jgi:hypothetical protein